MTIRREAEVRETREAESREIQEAEAREETRQR